MARWVQRFEPDVEADYQASLAEDKLRVARLSAALTIMLFTTFGVLELWALPSAIGPAWGIRGLIIAASLAFLALSLWWPPKRAGKAALRIAPNTPPQRKHRMNTSPVPLHPE